jgi:hypothetical protein
MPGARLKHGLSDKKLIRLIAIVENQFALRTGFVRAANAEMIAIRVFVAMKTSREHIASDSAGIVGKAVPKPKFCGVGITELREWSANPAAREMNSAVDFPGRRKVRRS